MILDDHEMIQIYWDRGGRSRENNICIDSFGHCSGYIK
jgi:hypothetical protein